MTLSSEKYVAVTTFRKSGAPVSTPTWIVPLTDGRLGFWTSSSAGKAKRLRNNPAVTVQASDARGRVKPGAESVRGSAQVVTSGPDFDSIQEKIKAKYGAMVFVTKIFNWIGHLGRGQQPYGDLGIVISVDGPDVPG
jgi:PPOX class probable F420-dependent enzyme